MVLDASFSPPVPEAAAVPPSCLSLGPSLTAAAAARQFLRNVLAEHGLTDRFEDVGTLLLSEVVTNAVRHAGTSMEVQLTVQAAGLRVAVMDGSSDLPNPPEQETAGPIPESGRGVLLLGLLATRWGADVRPGGKCVWFELAD